MPIPESESFKAKKPTVPPTFDGVDYDDQVALKKAQDSILREQWVRSMMARLVREELGKCYRREGVNHLEKCSALRERYMELLKESKVRGYMFQQYNYVPGAITYASRVYEGAGTEGGPGTKEQVEALESKIGKKWE